MFGTSDTACRAGTVRNVIGFLQGVIHGDCVLVGGVGYVVHTPHAFTDGQAVELHVTTVVREDDISLYGFQTLPDKEMFRLLRTVPGIGPVAALSALEKLGAAGVVAAVEAGDHNLLKGAKGIGPKAQQAICMTLRGKIPDWVKEISPAAVNSDLADLITTLENLGYRPEQARAGAEKAVASHPDAGVNVQVRVAMRHLSVAA